MINDQCHIDPERMQRFFRQIDIAIWVAALLVAGICVARLV